MLRIEELEGNIMLMVIMMFLKIFSVGKEGMEKGMVRRERRWMRRMINMVSKYY
jgi:hypothetical protein